MDFLNLFVRPPGDLLYFLAVVAISQAGLFMALGQRLRRPEDRGAQRYMLATLGVVLTWVLLMVGALFALLSNQKYDVILPPLERAASVITVLLPGWAFLTADHQRWRKLSNVVVLLVLLITIVGYTVTGVQWFSMADRIDFNLSVYGIAWTFAAAVLAGLGMVLTIVYFRLIVDAPLKLVFFAVLLVGYGGTLLQISQGQLIGNYAGLARLTFLGALPIVPAIIYRMVIGQLESASRVVPMSPLGRIKSAASESQPPQALSPRVAEPVAPVPVVSPVERQSVQLLKVLGQILEGSSPANIPQNIVNATVDMLKADVGAILKLQDANYADFTVAYDKRMGRSISGMALNLENQPTLVNAIERHQQRPLFPDRNVEELQDFYTRLDISATGPVYFQPLVHEKTLVAILVVAFPYSVLELHDTEEELLKGIAVMSSSLLALSYAANDARRFAEERAIEAMVEGVPPDQLSDTSVLAKRQEMEASLQLARDQITELSRQVVQLTIQLDDERSRLATALDDSQEDLSISQRLTALNDEQRKLREERDQLAARLQEAEAALAAATQPDNKAVVQKLIEGLEREKTDLMAQRENLQTQVDDLQIADRALLPQELQKVIRGMAEEKSRLESERDQLSRELAEIENQLRSVGISDPSTGLSQLIGKLSEQQAILQAKFDAVKAERDILINEHGRLNDGKEKERETRIQTLQTELVQVAADREAAIKQRDRLRTERDEIVAKLETVKQHRARLLAQSAGYEIELAEAHEQQAKLHVEIQQLSDERSELLRRHDDLVAEKQALETERDQLMARVDGDRERLKQLGEDGVGSLTKMIETLSTQRSQLERELHETRSRLAEVTNRLDALQVRSDADPSITEAVKYQPENPDLVIGLVQELRTPMTSVSGYIDLLLGETPGILGEMQRKFLERVAANVTRLASMIDDLVRVTELDTGHVALEPEPVDIVSLIDDAINNASAQFREKGLTVQLDLDNDLPAVRADRDAMTQIIGQLLTNAYLVSPPGSDIFITAKRKNINLSRNGNSNTHSTTDSLFVSVEDRGGGISPEDAARVFARKYKAENPLIAGLGDTGVGLSIAKALVEAHNGRLWLETRPNLGSIFNFALPLNATVEVEGEH